MKKNLFYAVILCLGLIAVTNSCVKDTFTEQDAYAEQRKNELLQDSLAQAKLAAEANMSIEQMLLLDSLKKVGGVINYSVGIVNASQSSWLPTDNMYGGKGTQGLDGVTVTIAQHGVIMTTTTDASGIASFKDLRIGTANVNILKTGYTTVDFVVEFPPISYEEYMYNYYDGDGIFSETESWTTHIVDLVRHAATMIPVFSLTDNLSTIKGIATVETDLTNNAPEVAAGINVKGVIDVEDPDFYGTYLNYNIGLSKGEASSWFDFYGNVLQIAFGGTVSTATTGADGSFTLQVPSSPQGLPILLRFDEFAANQTLLLARLGGVPVWGPQIVRTMFGYDIGTTTPPALGLGADQVQQAYVEFSDPAGSPAAQPTTPAAATAVLTSSGIVSINMTSPGTGYTQPPIVKIPIGTAFNSVQAEGTAVMSGGQITGVTITSPGTGYKSSDNPTVAFIGSDSVKAVYVPEFTYSVADIVLASPGSGYGQTAPAVTVVGSGTGATAHAVMAADIKTVDLTSPGSGYTQAPLVTISDNFKAWDGAVAVMTTENPILSIVYDGTNTQLWPAAPLPTVTIGGNGAGATATATLATTGGVLTTTALVGGTGYATAPEVTISGGGGFGATATATTDGNAITGVTIVTSGQGYTSAPTITFTGGGGSGASVTAVLGFKVASITLGTPGVNYTVAGTTVNLNNGGPIPAGNVNYTADCVIKYNMSVNSITLTNTAGYVFSAVPTVTFTPKDGLGTGATATVTLNWGIIDIVVDAPGSGYKEKTEPTSVLIAPPGGSGTQATATPRLGNGKLASVRVVSQGEGYTAAPNVYMTVSTSAPAGVIPVKQAELSATVAGGHVTGLTIVDPGEGYDLASDKLDKYSIVISTFMTGAGATAKANPESGKIAYIQVSNPGAGYSVVPEVEIFNDTQGDANGFGTGAVATAFVADGRISEITVTNGGSGYYVAPNVRIVVASSVMKAMGRCIVNDDGRITGVDFTNPTGWTQLTKGYGYDSAPTVTFFPSVPGKGTGATAIATINGGKVDKVIMINEGSGYVGKNRATGIEAWLTGSWRVNATAGKAYVKDINFGTGKRTVD